MKIEYVEATYENTIDFAIFSMKIAKNLPPHERVVLEKILSILFQIKHEIILTDNEASYLELILKEFNDCAELAEWQIAYARRSNVLMLVSTLFDIGKSTIKYLHQLPNN